MRETCLFTPGPLSLSGEVKEAMIFDLGSRDEAFKQITQSVRDRLLIISGGQETHSAIPVQGSGTFAMEAALTTFMSKNDKALVCVNGLYGERITKILTCIDIEFEVVQFSDLTPIDPTVVERALMNDSRITHLCVVHCETTTGLINPLPDILKVARVYGLTTIVDAMSSLGGLAVADKIHDIDILVSSGNKCIEAPAGVAFAIVAKHLLSEKSNAHSFCLDLLDQWRNFEETREWRTTPPTHVVQALDKALEKLLYEGVCARASRYTKVKNRLLEGMEQLGFQVAIEPQHQSPICLAFRSMKLVRDELSFSQYYSALTNSDLYIYAKFHNQTKTFRIGCIGQIQDAWIERLLSATASHFGLTSSVLAA